jgi:tRNA(fMet)-specific endonuclease VapC
MGKVIDSSIFIAIERGKLGPDVLARATDAKEPVAIAAISASELLHGVHRTATPSQRAKREAFVEQLLADLSIIPFDLVIARIHARLWAELATKGTTIGAHDLIIAASALSLGYDVATRNPREFSKVPGLTVVTW